MKNVTRLKIGPVALLVLLGLLALLVVKPEKAEDDVVQTVVKVEDTVVHDQFALGAFLVLTAMCVFLAWAAFRASEAEDKGTPPAREAPE